MGPGLINDTSRTFTPPSFITSHTADRLQDAPINPWDVMTAAAFIRALGASDPMLVNRWLYRRSPAAPPFEEVGVWRSGPGASRVIRKDRAIAWARSGGQTIAKRDCWPQAATALAKMGWVDLAGPDRVQEVVSHIIGNGSILLAMPLRDWTAKDRLYLAT
jgi:hypothetical protein